MTTPSKTTPSEKTPFEKTRRTRETTPEASRRLSWYSAALHVALVLLAVQVVLLVRGQAPGERSAATPLEPFNVLQAGDKVAPMAVQALDGEAATLDFASTERDTLLLVFTTTCPACQANAPSWVELYDRIEDGVDVVGVSLDEPEATRDYVARQGFRFPVVTPARRDGFARRHGIPGVPHTVWINAEGSVRETWLGLLEARQLDQLTQSPRDEERLSAAG